MLGFWGLAARFRLFHDAEGLVARESVINPSTPTLVQD